MIWGIIRINREKCSGCAPCVCAALRELPSRNHCIVFFSFGIGPSAPYRTHKLNGNGEKRGRPTRENL